MAVKMGYRPNRWKPSKARLAELISIHCGNIQLIAQSTNYKPRTVKTWLKEYPELKAQQEIADARRRLNASLRSQHGAYIQPHEAKRLFARYYSEIEPLSHEQLKRLEMTEEIEQVNNVVSHEGELLQRSKSSTANTERTDPTTGKPLAEQLSWADVEAIVIRLKTEQIRSMPVDYILRVWCKSLGPISDPDSDHEYANLPAPDADDTEQAVRKLLLLIEGYL